MITKTTFRTTASLVAAGAALLVTATASAQDRRDGDGPLADGILTRAEAVQQANERFERFDANADGYVSEAEIEDAKARMKAEREERRAERGEGEGREGRRGKRGKRGGDKAGGERFERQDTNEDGFISRAEAETAALARFDETDANGDGEVTREEMRAQREAKSQGARGDRQRGR